MHPALAKMILDREAWRCLENFSYDPPLSDEGKEELGRQVFDCISRSSSEEIAGILYGSDYSFEDVLNGSTPMHSPRPERVSNIKVAWGINYCLAHNILFLRCEELLLELRRAEHGIVS